MAEEQPSPRKGQVLRKILWLTLLIPALVFTWFLQLQVTPKQETPALLPFPLATKEEATKTTPTETTLGVNPTKIDDANISPEAMDKLLPILKKEANHFGANHFDAISTREAILSRTSHVLSSPTNATTSILAIDKDVEEETLKKKRIRRICLLGERNSGTNYMRSLMEPWFRTTYGGPDRKQPFVNAIPVFKYKHMFRHELLNAEELGRIQEHDDILWVMAIRRPCNWMDGMYRKPWHMCSPKRPHNGNYSAMVWPNCPFRKGDGRIDNNYLALRGISRAQFHQLEWGDWAESEITPDNFVYPNVWELRAHKIRLMQQVESVVPPERVIHAALHLVERDPVTFIANLHERLGLTMPPHQKIPAPSTNQHAVLCLGSQAEVDATRSLINWTLESDFGFSETDCPLCSG